MGYTTSLGYTPIFNITKGGEEVTSGFIDRLLSIRVESYEGDGQSDTVSISIDDRDWMTAEPSYGEGSITLEVSLGYKEGAVYEMGTFQVDELHHVWPPRAILLQGNSAGLNTNLKAPIISSYEGKSLGEVVNSIAQARGAKAAVDPSLSDIKIPYLNQNCSMGHLLNELERRFNGLAKFSNGHLSFTQRGTGLTVSGAELNVVTLYPEDTTTGCDIRSNSIQAYSKVRASYIDRTNNQQVWVESTTKGSPNSTVPYMVKRPHASEAEALAVANAQMARLNRSTKQGTIVLAKGCPEIRGGSKVILSRFRPGIDDTYVVSCATHVLGKDTGLNTTLTVYTEDGADDATGDEAPTTAPSFDEMTAGTTVPLGQGGIGHM